MLKFYIDLSFRIVIQNQQYPYKWVKILIYRYTQFSSFQKKFYLCLYFRAYFRACKTKIIIKRVCVSFSAPSCRKIFQLGWYLILFTISEFYAALQKRWTKNKLDQSEKRRVSAVECIEKARAIHPIYIHSRRIAYPREIAVSCAGERGKGESGEIVTGERGGRGEKEHRIVVTLELTRTFARAECMCTRNFSRARREKEEAAFTYLSRGSIHVVFFVLWSMKYTFPSKSWATSHPSGSGISPFRLLGIFHCALNPSKSSLSIAVRSTDAYLWRTGTRFSSCIYASRSLGQRENKRERDGREEGGREGGERGEKGETREKTRPAGRETGGRERARSGGGGATRTGIKRYCAHTHTPRAQRPGAYMCVRAVLSLSFFLWFSLTTPPSWIPHYHERSDVRVPAFRFLSSGIPPLT